MKKKQKQKADRPIKMIIHMLDRHTRYADAREVLKKYVDYLNNSPFKGLISEVSYEMDHQIHAVLISSHAATNRMWNYPAVWQRSLVMNASEFGGPERVRYRFMP